MLPLLDITRAFRSPIRNVLASSKPIRLILPVKQSSQVASYITMSTQIPINDLESFQEHLRKSTRILALLGAGLSAASGLPTFRGSGGLWRDQEAVSLATPEAFEADPGLVWQFYSYRRHMALNAKPNPAHYALAELAKTKPEFVTLSQNVDGLSPRAGHPNDQLLLIHGSLFDVKCSGFGCKYVEPNNYTDPLVPALEIPREGPQPEPSIGNATSSLMDAVRYKSSHREADISNSAVPLPSLSAEELPQCPQCKSALLRPGVVWFGEALPGDALKSLDAFISDRRQIDLCIVIGTSAKVYPAAGYVDIARYNGARVAVVNTDINDKPGKMAKGDWFFEGDASVLVPKLFENVIGQLPDDLKDEAKI